VLSANQTKRSLQISAIVTRMKNQTSKKQAILRKKKVTRLAIQGRKMEAKSKDHLMKTQKKTMMKKVIYHREVWRTVTKS